jgi:TolB-like protein
MKKRTKILASVILAFFATLHAAAALAGQVVTGEDRAWAKKAVSEEKTLGAAEAKNTVAVLYFRNGTGQPALDPLQKGIALMLVTDLSQVPDLQVVERVKLQSLAEELGLGALGLIDPGTAPRVGKILQARWIVGGDIAKGSGVPLAVRETVVDVPSTGTIGQPASQGDLDQIFRIEKDLLFETIKILKVEVTPEVRKRLEKPCSKNPAALLALSRGVDESDRGNYAKAADLYESAIKEDPGVCLAGETLEELFARGLVPRRKPRASGTLEVLQGLKDATSLTNRITTKEQVRTIVNPAGNIPSNRNINVTFP